MGERHRPRGVVFKANMRVLAILAIACVSACGAPKGRTQTERDPSMSYDACLALVARTATEHRATPDSFDTPDSHWADIETADVKISIACHRTAGATIMTTRR